MLQHERFETILSKLNRQSSVRVKDLSEELGVSESTIRRDITDLDREGRLRKVFGGAVPRANRTGIEASMVASGAAANKMTADTGIWDAVPGTGSASTSTRFGEFAYTAAAATNAAANADTEARADAATTAATNAAANADTEARADAATTAAANADTEARADAATTAAANADAAARADAATNAAANADTAARADAATNAAANANTAARADAATNAAANADTAVNAESGTPAVNHHAVNTTSRDLQEKEALQADEKTEVAVYAATLIGDGELIYIDAGTTTGRMIDHITCRDAVFVTNGVRHALRLASRGLRTYLLSGRVKTKTEAVIGYEAVGSLEKYHFSKCFIGTDGIDVECGLTTADIDESMVKTEAMNRSGEVYVLADSSKFGLVASVTFAPLDAGTVITDRLPDQAYRAGTRILELNQSK